MDRVSNHLFVYKTADLKGFLKEIESVEMGSCRFRADSDFITGVFGEFI